MNLPEQCQRYAWLFTTIAMLGTSACSKEGGRSDEIVAEHQTDRLAPPSAPPPATQDRHPPPKLDPAGGPPAASELDIPIAEVEPIFVGNSDQEFNHENATRLRLEMDAGRAVYKLCHRYPIWRRGIQGEGNYIDEGALAAKGSKGKRVNVAIKVAHKDRALVEGNVLWYMVEFGKGGKAISVTPLKAISAAACGLAAADIAVPVS